MLSINIMSNNKNDLKSAQINLDSLMDKMKSFSNNSNDNSNSSRLDKATKHKASNAKSPNNKGSNKKNKKASNDKPKQEPSKKRKLSQSKGSDDHSKSIHNDNGYSNSLENKVDKNNKNPQTSLQAKMKKSLSGARFRLVFLKSIRILILTFLDGLMRLFILLTLKMLTH